MARVRSIEATELPDDLAEIYREFAASYGPFRNQVAVVAAAEHGPVRAHCR